MRLAARQPRPALSPGPFGLPRPGADPSRSQLSSSSPTALDVTHHVPGVATRIGGEIQRTLAVVDTARGRPAHPPCWTRTARHCSGYGRPPGHRQAGPGRVEAVHRAHREGRYDGVRGLSSSSPATVTAASPSAAGPRPAPPAARL